MKETTVAIKKTQVETIGLPIHLNEIRKVGHQANLKVQETIRRCQAETITRPRILKPETVSTKISRNQAAATTIRLKIITKIRAKTTTSL